MGEWHDVIIDRQLPRFRRAHFSDTKEYWVPLVEKAFAQFNGSYSKGVKYHEILVYFKIFMYIGCTTSFLQQHSLGPD